MNRRWPQQPQWVCTGVARPESAQGVAKLRGNYLSRNGAETQRDRIIQKPQMNANEHRSN